MGHGAPRVRDDCSRTERSVPHPRSSEDGVPATRVRTGWKPVPHRKAGGTRNQDGIQEKGSTLSRGFRTAIAALVFSTSLALAVRAQTPRPDSEVAPVLNSGHIEQIRTCREGILDAAARSEDRRRWIELLLSYDSSESHALVGELLRAPTKPEIQRAVCDVVYDRGREDARKLVDAFVEPLVDLLESESAPVRTAAARTLAAYRMATVPARLGSIASDTTVAIHKRLAAIDALAPNIHRREVVEQLVPLLDSDAAEIVSRVSATLEPGFSGTLASAPAERRAWLRQKLTLSPEAWLDEQLDVYHERSLRLRDELGALRESAKREQSSLTIQLGSLQRELYRALPPEQRPAKLIDWLGSALPATQLNALGIIKAAIGEEGKRPENEVLSAVLRLLASPPAAVRREALFIAQALNDPAVVDAVLARVEIESDPAVRPALFGAFGKLETLQAVPALLREVADARATVECAREAALALGQIAGGAAGASVRRDCIVPLKVRYQGLPAGEQSLRSALLAAMARVADPAFTQEFLDAVESEEPAVLQPAIQGLRATREVSKVPRLRILVGHADPSVRLAAIEAICELGREELDVETLRLRLNSAVETSAIVREAAWKAFHDIVVRRPLAEQIRAADRLRDTPELAIRYLEELLDTASANANAGSAVAASGNANARDMFQIRDRLATSLLSVQRYAQAAPHLRQLYESPDGGGGNGHLEYGTRWFSALLHAAPPKEVAAAVLQLRRSAADHAVQAVIVETFQRFADSPAFLADRDRARSLCGELKTACGDDWIPAWSDAIARAVERLDAPESPRSAQPQ